MTISIVFPSKGVCDPAFAQALKLLQIQEPFDRMEVNYVPGADVAVARNLLAEKAIGDYIFFIDDDVLPPINTIEKLYNHKKDIVSGLYFAKQQPHFPQIFKDSKRDVGRYDSVENYEKDALIEIDACGAGCMLIKKEVFEKLKQPYFQYIPKSETTPRKGEDYFFCEKAKKAGFKIFCDTSVLCKHIGTKYITAEFWEISLQQIAQMKKEMGEKKFEEFKKQQRDN